MPQENLELVLLRRTKMNKQIDNKAIEEMAKIICGGCPNGKECMRCLCADWYKAEALYNAGYCKVADDEVVLNQKELAELTVQMSLNSEKMAEIRKEKAREILQKIAYEYEYAYCNRDTKWFERICKEYNIDINLFY